MARRVPTGDAGGQPMSLAQKVAANTAALVLGRVVVVTVGVVSVALASRYLGPSAFGALAVSAALIALLSVMADLGIYTIASREIAKRTADTDRIIATTFAIGLTLSVALAGVAVALAFVLYGGADGSLIRQGVAILTIQLVATAPTATIRAFLVSRQRAYLSVFGDVAGAVASITVVSVAVATDAGFAAVISAQAAAAVANATLMCLLTRRVVRLRPSFDLRRWRPMLRWSIPLGVAMVINDLYFRIDLLLLSFYVPDAEVALYGLAYKIIEALIVLPNFLMLTLLPEMARLSPHTPRLSAIVQQTFNVMQAISVPLLVIGTIFAEEIVQILGGDAFSEAAPVLRLLVVALAVSYLSGVFGQALVALNRERRLLQLSIFVLALNVGLNLALIPVWGVKGAATAVMVSELAAFVCVRWLYGEIGEIAGNPATPRVVAAGLAMAIVLPLKLIPGIADSAVVVLACGVPLALTIYVVVLRALHAVPEVIDAEILPPLRKALTRS